MRVVHFVVHPLARACMHVCGASISLLQGEVQAAAA